jgi:hypothetical protein
MRNAWLWYAPEVSVHLQWLSAADLGRVAILRGRRFNLGPAVLDQGLALGNIRFDRVLRERGGYLG